jgi:hypothetical protein
MCLFVLCGVGCYVILEILALVLVHFICVVFVSGSCPLAALAPGAGGVGDGRTLSTS